MAIKMADNPANLQAVIPNEIIIICPKRRTSISFQKKKTYITATLLKYGLYNGFIKAEMPKGTRRVSSIIRKLSDLSLVGGKEKNIHDQKCEIRGQRISEILQLNYGCLKSSSEWFIPQLFISTTERN